MWLTPENVFLVVMFLMISQLVIWPIFSIVVAFLMPKEIMRRYFCEPYFSRTEQIMLTATPFSFMRLAAMTWLIAFPRFGRKRGITDIHEHCPTWYVRLCQVFNCWIFGQGGAAVLLMIGLLIYGWLTL